MALLTPVEPQAHTRSIAILCIVAAVALWSAVKLSREYDTEVSVPVEYELPAGLTFAEAPPGSITVALDGTGWDLLGRQLRPRYRAVRIDSTQIKSAGDNGIPVLRAVERAFAGAPLNVTRAAPERISPVTSKVATRRLAVRLRSEITYAESFAGQVEPLLDPDTVSVSGPASVLARLTEWPTDSLRLANVRDTVSVRVTLADSDGVRVQPRSVSVQIAGEQVAERTLEVPVGVVGVEPADSVVVVPRTVKLRVVVGMSRFAGLRGDDFELVADVRGLDFAGDPQSVLVEVRQAPDGLHGLSLDPAVVTAYRIRRSR